MTPARRRRAATSAAAVVAAAVLAGPAAAAAGAPAGATTGATAAVRTALPRSGVRSGVPRAAVDGVRVTVGAEEVDTAVGGRFTVRTVLTNDADAATGPMLAHLNVAGLAPDVYVDPEDWSTQRSRYLDPLAPHTSVTLDWQLQAVQAGSFDTYVVLLPTAEPGPAHGLVVSRSVRVTVAGRRTLSAGGVLPVAVTVPAVLGVLVGSRLRRRRT